MDIKFKRLRNTAQLPTRGTIGSAGLDLYASRIEYDGVLYICHSDIAFEIPRGYVGLLFPRSSIANTPLRMTNCVGVIDSDYRGEVMAKFDLKSEGDIYKVGDRFAQIIFMPYEVADLIEVDELSTTKRGTGGYGSTNNPPVVNE